MALDVFHQVLKRLSDTAGGNPRQMVSIVDVLKQEKLFGSIDMILNKFHTEGWIAEAPTKDHVYVTTWGIDEVRRADAPGSSSGTARGPKADEPKNAAALREAAGKARELAELLTDLAAGEGGTAAQRKAKAKKALASVSTSVDEAFD
jgi:hypothetical protein